jgi:hypothetical protein
MIKIICWFIFTLLLVGGGLYYLFKQYIPKQEWQHTTPLILKDEMNEINQSLKELLCDADGKPKPPEQFMKEFEEIDELGLKEGDHKEKFERLRVRLPLLLFANRNRK